MCSNKMWDFNCPQFVDFQAGLETSTTDIWLEDENDHQKAMAFLSQPFRSRMATPKLNINLKKSPFLNMPDKQFKTDDEKLASKSQLHRRYSKSDICLNRPVDAWMTPKVKPPNRAQKAHRKRSLSENNTKKKICPVTPMCLKRTQKKTKGKTSEEIEMDKIAQLQSNLKQQLRLNEVNLQRMRSNKAPYPIQKVINQKCNSKARTAVEIKDDNLYLQPSGLNKRKTKSQYANFEKTENSKERRSKVLNVKVKKLRSIFDSVSKKSEGTSNALRVVNGNNKEQQGKKYNDYCGLKFFPNQGKTVPQPFSFDTSSVSSQSASFCFKDIKADSFALKTPNLEKEKENIFRSMYQQQRK